MKYHLREFKSLEDVKAIAELLCSVQCDYGGPCALCFISESQLLKINCEQLDTVEIEDDHTHLKYYKRVIGVHAHSVIGGFDFDEYDLIFTLPCPPLQANNFNIRKVKDVRYNIAAEIKVRKVCGYQYPCAETEDMCIEQYFKLPRHFNSHELLIIPLVTHPTEKRPRLPSDHLLSSASCLYYYIESIDSIDTMPSGQAASKYSNVSADRNHHHLSSSPQLVAITSTDVTRIVLATESQSLSLDAPLPLQPLSALFQLTVEFMFAHDRHARTLHQLACAKGGSLANSAKGRTQMQALPRPPPLGLLTSVPGHGDVCITSPDPGKIRIMQVRDRPSVRPAVDLIEHLHLTSSHKHEWQCGCSGCAEAACATALAGATLVQSASQTGAIIA